MKKAKKWPFFVMAAVILIATYLVIFGLSFQNGDIKEVIVKGADSIRWGIDIRGGVDATFNPADGYDASEDEMNSAQSIIEIRLINLGITDYEVYTDYSNDRIIVRFPWKVGETDFNPEAAIKELGETAHLTFREGVGMDANGQPTGNIVIEGKDLVKAELASNRTDLGAVQYVVSFKLTPEGSTKFATATEANLGKPISIWMDNTLISAPTVNSVITGGEGVIEGAFTAEEANDLATKINGGALPFKLNTENYSSISPTLGQGAKDAMVTAGIIAFVLVCAYMLVVYRLPGFVAIFALLGQVIFMIGAVTKIFPAYSSFTLTLPGIAGIILGIGMGVDANIISAERIKEEIRSGKTIDGSVNLGFERAFSAILDGNVTVVIVAIILMGAFGPPDSILVKMFSPIFFIFGKATAGSIYSFGYTLLMGVLANMVMGVYASRAMLRSISQLKCFRKAWLYGGDRTELATAAPAKGNKVMPKAIDFYGKRKLFMSISLGVIALCVVFSLVFGVQLDIQFRGGSLVTYSHAGTVNTDDIEKAVEEVMGGNVSVQQGKNASTGTTTFTISLAQSQGISPDKQIAITEKLVSMYPDGNIDAISLNNVDATIGREFLVKSIVAVAVASLFMILYVAYRFRNIGGWSAGVMAVVALLHDTFIVFAAFVFLRIPLNDNFIAVVLTILGYSLNATIVIYDRIRENEQLMNRRETLATIVNTSITQSLGRAFGTSLATAMSMVVVAIVAGVSGISSIITFALPLLAGIVSGCYSSVVLAAPMWVMWENKHPSRRNRER